MQCIHCGRTDGHDLINKRLHHFVTFKVVQTKLADFVLVVLVLGQVSACGTARDSKCFKMHPRMTAAEGN